MAGIPLIIYGQITESNSAVSSVTVKCRNERSNEVGTTTTDSNGLYLFDLSAEASFPSGWVNGDQVTIYTIYSNFEGQSTITIALPLYGYETNIALSAVTDSELIYYCSVQDVYDELDAKTSSDISTDRIVKSVQRAEGLIDTKTGTSFKIVTVTNEVHTGDRYSLDISPDYLDTLSPLINSRRDTRMGIITNRVKVDNTPIISITSLSVNQAGADEADDWTALTQQTGSSGDYVLENANAGIIDFLDNYPRVGKRSWKATYTYGYDPDSTDRRITSLLKVVERLTILLACKSIITTKSTGSMFDSTRDVRIGTIEIKAGAQSASQYLNSIEPEIVGLWKELGELGVEVI